MVKKKKSKIKKVKKTNRVKKKISKAHNKKVKHNHKKTNKVKHSKKGIKNKKISTKIARVYTNIPNFDKLIGGGFEKNTTNLLVGGSGGGKTIFATQFLVEAMKNGERCLYVTFEEKKEQFFSNMLQFGWDLYDYEKRGLFIFLEYAPMKVKTMLEEGGGAIESIILSKKIQRIVLDSITSFELLFDNELEKREAALDLFGMIREWNATALLTLEEEPSKQEKISSRTLEFESDSITVLYFIRENNKPQRERFLEVIKMRGSEHANKVYPFDITKKGIFIKKKPLSHFKLE